MKIKSIELLVLLIFLCLLIARTADATSYTLTLFSQGSGAVTPDNTNNPHSAGVNINITATASNGWYFSSWSGSASGTSNPLQVTMNSNLVITGNFLPFPIYPVALVTNGQGSIVLNPPSGNYVSNTLVTATATPANGWFFVGWSGGTNTGANPISLYVNTNEALTGTFAQLPAFDVQPVSVTNQVGSTVSFYGHAVGAAPLGYQWYFTGGSLPFAASNTTLTLTNAALGFAGNYSLVVTNGYGSATSQVVSLVLTNFIGPTNLVNSPDEASLRAAIGLGGWVGIKFNGTLTISNTIDITNNVILDASGVSATVSGGDAVRLFNVASGASLTASNLSLADGACLITNGPPGTPADGGAIYNNGTVNLAGCTLSNNVARSSIFGGLARGGAVFNDSGRLSLCQSLIISNLAVGGGQVDNTANVECAMGFGGAIYNTNGEVTLDGCSVSGNVCNNILFNNLTRFTAVVMGGGAYQASGSLTISNSSFVSNQAVGGNNAGDDMYGHGSPAYGGGVAVIGGSLTILNSQCYVNQAIAGGGLGIASPAYGGAVYCSATGSAANSVFFGNQTFAGNYNYNNNGVTGYGGCLYNTGTFQLNRCLVYSNSVYGGSSLGEFGAVNGGDALGGGFYNTGLLTATNCTLTGNFTVGGRGNGGGFGTAFAGSGIGGGIYNDTNVTFIGMNLTIASNLCSSPSGSSTTNGFASGFQVANNTNGMLHLHNSIIAYSGTNANAYGSISDDGYNICSDGSADLLSGSSYNDTDPLLAPLGNSGGPTWCMALLASSPAIDSADPADFPSTDQRGYVRPFGSGPDIGAFEYGAMPPPPKLGISSARMILQFTFTTTTAGTYVLQSSTNLITWVGISTNGPFSGTTNITQTVNKQSTGGSYFRLLVQ